MSNCPLCDAQLYGPSNRCPCGWVRSLDVVRNAPDRPWDDPPKPLYQPTAEQLDAVRRAAKRTGPSGPWWTVERVETQQQVDHIIRQASHFGSMSQAARFYADCRAAGAIVDGRLVAKALRKPVVTQREREAGEDTPEDIGEETGEPAA